MSHYQPNCDAQQLPPKKQPRSASNIADLVSRIQQNDDDAFAEFFNTYKGPLTGILSAYYQRESSATIEDAVQLAFIGFYKWREKLSALESSSPLPLLTVMGKYALRTMQGKAFNKHELMIIDDPPAPKGSGKRVRKFDAVDQRWQPLPESRMERKLREYLPKLEQALSTLSPSEADLIAKRYREGMTSMQIAASTNTCQRTTQYRISTALEKLRKELTGEKHGKALKFERTIAALNSARWNIRFAAKILGVSRVTIANRVREYREIGFNLCDKLDSATKKKARAAVEAVSGTPIANQKRG